MVNVLHRLEYGAAFLLIVLVYFYFDFSLWLFFLLLFVPDVTMFGYFFNNKVGAIIYNIGHNLIIPLILLGAGLFFNMGILLLTSFVWLAHIFMDRFIGYGLKYSSSFKETHMQKI